MTKELLAQALRDHGTWATAYLAEKARADGLEEQLEAVQRDLEVERRDRKWWAANNSRERQRLQEQFEALKRAVRDYVNDEIGLMDLFKIAFPEDFAALQAIEASSPAIKPDVSERGPWDSLSKGVESRPTPRSETSDPAKRTT